MKKLILGIGVLALTFASVIPASAICRNADGTIDEENGMVFSANKMGLVLIVTTPVRCQFFQGDFRVNGSVI